jgi:SNF2-related domain/Helicase conserved C-terminal domain
MQKFELRQSQTEDLAKFIQNPRFLDLSEPGTGKTPKVNVFMYWLWHRHQKKSVFVMPLSLFDQNKHSFMKFTNFNEDEICVVQGTPKQRQFLMHRTSKAKVFIVGFNFFKPAKGSQDPRQSDFHYIMREHPDIGLVAVDEFHMGYSTPESMRTRWLMHWLRQLNEVRFLAMTGTIVDGRLSSIYGAISIIEPRYYVNYVDFMNQHAIRDTRYPSRVLAWKNADKVKRILQHHSVRRTFLEEYGPASMEIFVEEVSMSREHRRIYEEYEDTGIWEKDDEFEYAEDALHQLRCRQILGAPEAMGFDLKGGFIGKDDRILEHLGDLDDHTPVVIFAAYQPEQERLLRVLREKGYKVGLINGNVSGANRILEDQAFREGHTQVMIASPATVSVGYNWSHVDYMFFYTIDYKDTNWDQALFRAIRGVRECPLRAYLMYYTHTRERKVIEKIRTKMKLAAATDSSRRQYEFGKLK